jgi:hypothetical protein
MRNPGPVTAILIPLLLAGAGCESYSANLQPAPKYIVMAAPKIEQSDAFTVLATSPAPQESVAASAPITVSLSFSLPVRKPSGADVIIQSNSGICSPNAFIHAMVGGLCIGGDQAAISEKGNQITFRISSPLGGVPYDIVPTSRLAANTGLMLNLASYNKALLSFKTILNAYKPSSM